MNGHLQITIVGGNRGTGAQLARLAVQAGHQVTCLSRSGAGEEVDGVRYLTGDALDPEVARSAVTGADAVVVTVGGSNGSDGDRAAVTRSIITAMQQAGVRRLVVQSSLGVGDSMELMPGPARVFARAVLGRALADHAEQEAAAAASGLDWTVLRPGGLTDGPATGSYLAQQTAEHRPMKGRISRADVATHALKVLDDPTTVGTAIALGTA